MSLKDKTAIVGIGVTEFYRRGQSGDKNHLRLACEAILAACEDAGIKPQEIDGFSSYAGTTTDAATMAPLLGTSEVRYSVQVWGGGGGGTCAAVGNASAAIMAGLANVVVVYYSLRQPEGARFGGTRTDLTIGTSAAPGGYGGSHPLAPSDGRSKPYGMGAPGQGFALKLRRHMAVYGTKQEHLGQWCITTREHAMRNPIALMRTPLTMDDYMNARMIYDPFRLYDCTIESDGGGAMIVVSAERARDFKQRPAYVMAVGQGADSRGGLGHDAPDDNYPTAGFTTIAPHLWKMAGVGPKDIDVAELYDHFSGMAMLTLEDFGFCGKGESGPFTAEGRTKWAGGDLPVNTHGGNLSCMYMPGITQIIEGVQQIRGTSTSQVKDAELCLCTSGPGTFPTSALILRR